MQPVKEVGVESKVTVEVPDRVDVCVCVLGNGQTLTESKMIPSERASQEEQNGANFSFIAPSILE